MERTIDQDKVAAAQEILNATRASKLRCASYTTSCTADHTWALVHPIPNRTRFIKESHAPDCSKETVAQMGEMVDLYIDLAAAPAQKVASISGLHLGHFC